VLSQAQRESGQILRRNTGLSKGKIDLQISVLHALVCKVAFVLRAARVSAIFSLYLFCSAPHWHAQKKQESCDEAEGRRRPDSEEQARNGSELQGGLLCAGATGKCRTSVEIDAQINPHAIKDGTRQNRRASDADNSKGWFSDRSFCRNRRVADV
jgi:hypothetical protein